MSRRVGKRLGPVTCKDCGREWAIDPVYAVDCPSCPAKAGQLCRRPSEGQTMYAEWHRERDLAADHAGAYRHQCTHDCPRCAAASTSHEVRVA